MSAPGSMNRCVGLWTSRKRRWRQPSRKLESLLSPPRGWYSIGNSRMSSFSFDGPDHHLGGELHAGRAQVEPRQHVAPQRAHAAVRVADAGAEEDVEDAGEDRVADVAVQPRHRARVDVVHPVAHDELGALVELLDEARDLAEVVREVGVAHHDVAAARGGEAGEVGAAVAAPRLVHDARAGRRGELGGAVLGGVVGDDDLARDAGARAAPSSAASTQRSMFSSSLRQGMTTETTSSSSAIGASASGVGSAAACSRQGRRRGAPGASTAGAREGCAASAARQGSRRASVSRPDSAAPRSRPAGSGRGCRRAACPGVRGYELEAQRARARSSTSSSPRAGA